MASPARYSCSACDAACAEDGEGWPVASCSCGAPISASMSASMQGGGGIV